ncbi:GPP34 family phosphoprotein [Amycolatopsis vastitatis]|uniref:GPP34 family phosphoprotein n=1 Tax=Amycolatopsis vastitatis TaxID=1905142 RepID=A0A229SLC9_9PSEU|nr:GPP34 family phosphoprotein [Amycolatopsis vastitatis]OXM59636.1 hypothetical protein CF165_46400 [Amycolatopsis vastitatis]
MTRYRGSDKLADLVLTAMFCRDMHRPLVHDEDRVAYIVGCMLLAELHQQQQIDIGRDGRIYPARRATNCDGALAAVLSDLQAERYAQPAGKWLDFLARDHRATERAWQRLVIAGVAEPEQKQWLRRRPRRALTAFLATAWARQHFEEHVTEDAEVPDAAVVLWRGLRELRIDDRALEMKPALRPRLEAAPFPPDLTPLFDALSHALARLATPL